MNKTEIEKQVKERCKKECGAYYYECHCECSSIEAFQDGAKWGMEHALEWHEAEELPPMETKNCTINVLTDTQEIAYFDISTNEWIRDSSSTIIDAPSYWCELPQFKDKE